jgi:hypothetical protein
MKKSTVNWIVVILAGLAFALMICACNIQKAYIHTQGVIVEKLKPDTIRLRKDIIIEYGYVVKEDNYPEKQLVIKYIDIHNVGDTLRYERYNYY